MSKFLRYMGEFLSHAGVVWRVEILQEAEQAFPNVGSLTFEAEEALLMEWEEKSKEEVIQGCMATIKLESPGDRTYEDLYTIEVGRIRMDVYRDGVLYWSGLLDAEFYEEPYEKAANYPVSLKFSDFGVLNRLKYDLAGMRSIKEVITYCLQRAGLNTELNTSLVSLCAAGSTTPVDLSDINVRSDNFFDEDGEALTLEEVLEGILQPLALRIVQRSGKVYVYDLNGLYSKGKQTAIVWDGASQTMGVDVVYNNAKITWSTYAQSGNLLPTTCWTLPVDKQLIALNNLSGGTHGKAKYFSYHYSTELKDWLDATDSGFTLWIAGEGQNAQILEEEAVKFFKIVPQYDGEESEGIALFYKAAAGYWIGSSSNNQSGFKTTAYGCNPAYLADTAAVVESPLFKSGEAWLPPVNKANDLLLRVSLNLLLDPRINPFEQAVNWMKYMEQKDWQDQWKSQGNYVYIPVCVKFQPDGGSDVYCWDNREIVKTPVSSPIKSLNGTFGKWQRYTQEADGTPGVWGYLCYYDEQNRTEGSGVANGWGKNRPAINPHGDRIITLLENCEDGQYIPYPTFGGGKIWVEVLKKGWMINDAGQNVSTTEKTNPFNLWGLSASMEGPKMSFILMQLPEIEIVNNVQFDQTINTDDVEYSAEINASAKESLEIDTICGTSEEGVPTAKGAYFNADNGKQITEFSRAGRTTQAEELLIGTLYSQFASRHTKLEGEAKIAVDGMAAYTEQNQEGKLFLLAGDVQDAIADTSQAVLIELSPDEYVKEGEA